MSSGIPEDLTFNDKLKELRERGDVLNAEREACDREIDAYLGMDELTQKILVVFQKRHYIMTKQFRCLLELTDTTVKQFGECSDHLNKCKAQRDSLYQELTEERAAKRQRESE